MVLVFLSHLCIYLGSMKSSYETIMEQGFVQRNIFNPLISLLKQGITAEKLAFSMALGITIGSFPILGTTTIICTAIALAFRLNFPAVQIGNWLAYPLQIVLMVPFMMMGEHLFGSGIITSSQTFAQLSLSDLHSGMRLMTQTAFHGIILWSVIAPFMLGSLYLLFLPLFRKWKMIAGGYVHD
jgi:uncharacterized protein (DUF2062 family)